MPGQGHDLLRPVVRRGDLRQQGHRRDQGAGGLPGGLPHDDRPRHLHHQRHGARRRLTAGALARCLLQQGAGQDLRQGRLHRQDHPVAGCLARVRRRQEGHRRRADRSQAPAERDRLPEGARVQRRGDPEALREAPSDPEHPGQGPLRDARGSARGHLPQAPARRAADGREREDPTREPVLQPEALRRGAGRQAQGRQEARRRRGRAPEAVAGPSQGARGARQPRQEGVGAEPVPGLLQRCRRKRPPDRARPSTRRSSPSRTSSRRSATS